MLEPLDRPSWHANQHRPSWHANQHDDDDVEEFLPGSKELAAMVECDLVPPSRRGAHVRWSRRRTGFHVEHIQGETAFHMVCQLGPTSVSNRLSEADWVLEVGVAESGEHRGRAGRQDCRTASSGPSWRRPSAAGGDGGSRRPHLTRRCEGVRGDPGGYMSGGGGGGLRRRRPLGSHTHTASSSRESRSTGLFLPLCLRIGPDGLGWGGSQLRWALGVLGYLPFISGLIIQFAFPFFFWSGSFLFLKIWWSPMELPLWRITFLSIF